MYLKTKNWLFNVNLFFKALEEFLGHKLIFFLDGIFRYFFSIEIFAVIIIISLPNVVGEVPPYF